MDKRRQALEEKQDALHMEILMDDYAAELGEQTRREAEAAYAGGALTYPPELDDAIRARIAAAPEPDKEHKTGKTALRYALVAALTVVLLLGAMIAVQAAGVDVFGKIASWTDSVFRFRNGTESSAEEETDASENPIRTALRKNGMPVELAPNWLPEGYVISLVDTVQVDETLTINTRAECAGRPVIRIAIIKGDAQPLLDEAQWEKTGLTPLQYTANNRTVYVIENESLWSGTWTDGQYCVSFFGFESFEELETIIYSMGEN